MCEKRKSGWSGNNDDAEDQKRIEDYCEVLSQTLILRGIIGAGDMVITARINGNHPQYRHPIQTNRDGLRIVINPTDIDGSGQEYLRISVVAVVPDDGS